MVAGINQQNSVRCVRHDSRRLAGWNAYRVHTGELSAVEIHYFMFPQLELANRAVVGVSHQQIIAVYRDSKRMLQACLLEVSIDPTKVKESGADERRDLRILRERDRAHGRALAVCNIERASIGAQRKPARLRERGRSSTPVTNTFLAGSGERGHGTRLEIEYSDLVRAGVREEQLVAFLFEIPRRCERGRMPRRWSAELSPALSRSGESGHRAVGEIDAPNCVTLGICHEDGIAGRDDALRVIEARLILCAVLKACFAGAVTLELLAIVVQQNDLIVTAVGENPAFLFARHGLQLPGKQEITLGFLQRIQIKC